MEGVLRERERESRGALFSKGFWRGEGDKFWRAEEWKKKKKKTWGRRKPKRVGGGN